jgi:hypothetical protein
VKGRGVATPAFRTRDRQAVPDQLSRKRLTRDIADELCALNEFAPRVIVDSGNGIQPIWVLDPFLARTERDRDFIEGLNRKLEAALGAEDTHNIDRLLRESMAAVAGDSPRRASSDAAERGLCGHRQDGGDASRRYLSTQCPEPSGLGRRTPVVTRTSISDDSR